MFLIDALFTPLLTIAGLLLAGLAAYRLWIFFRQNQKLPGKLERQQRATLKFSELSQQIISEVNLKKLFQLIVESAIDVCDGQTGSLMMLDETGMQLRISAAAGLPKVIIDETIVPLENGIAGLVVLRAKPVVIGSKVSDPDIIPLMKLQHRIFSAISAPIILENRVIGTLNVNRTTRREDFDEADAQTLYAFAGQVALAIDRAYLLEEISTQPSVGDQQTENA